MARFADVEAYVAAQPDDVRDVLERVRVAVREAVPGVTETISYDIPTFVLDGRPVLHVGAWKHHLSLYPAPGGDPGIEAAVAPYRDGASTVKLPWSDVPVDLVARVAAHHARARRR